MVCKLKNTGLGILVFCFTHLLNAQYDLNNNAAFKSAEILENHKIQRITEDPYGFIWIATSDNVFRFDGIDLQEYYQGTFVEILRDTSHQRMAFVHRKGLYIYHYRSGKTDTISLKTINGKEDNVLSAVFSKQEKDQMILGCNNGFIKYNLSAGTYEYRELKNKLNTATTFLSLSYDQENDSIMWMGSRKAGLYKYNLYKDTYNQYVFTEINPLTREEANTITQIVQDDNTLFLGTWHGGYLQFNIVDESYKQHFIEKINGAKPRDHVHRIFKTRSGDLWISSTKGARLLNPGSKEVLYSLNVDNILEVFGNAPQYIDSEQRIWLGRENGLRVIDTLRNKIKTLKNSLYKPNEWNMPKNIVKHDKSQTLYFCVLGGRGIYSYDLKNQTWTLSEPETPSPAGVFLGRKILPAENELLVLEEYGIYRLSYGNSVMQRINVSEQNNLVKLLDFTLLDPAHVLVLTSHKGIFKININTGRSEQYAAEIWENFRGVRRNEGDAVLKDRQGNVWMGWKNYLFVKTPNDTIINVTPAINFGNDINDVKHLHESDTYLYISLPKGIYRIDKTVLPRLEVQKVDNSDSNYALLDENGKLWWLFDKLEYKQGEGGDNILFDESDGLHNPGKYGYEYLDQVDDEIVVASRKAYSFFKPQDIQKSNYIPKPYIRAITVDGLEYKTDIIVSLIKQVNLQSDENNISIAFSAQAYSKPFDTSFRYKLKGIDKDWQYSSSENKQINYANLEDRYYEFVLQASNDKHTWSEASILQIINRVPFYTTTWFKFSIALIVLITLSIIHRSRLATLRYKAKSREKLLSLEKQALRAQMNPHFVFNAMNSIQHLITEGDEEKSISYLNKFSKLLRGVLENSRNPKATLENEVAVIENYLELEFLRLGDNYTYELNVAETLIHDHIEIPALLFQPFIENAIHHGLAHRSDGGHLKVELKDKEDHVLCVIEDNGVGRQRARELSGWKNHRSAGIAMVQKRLDLLSDLRTDTTIRIIDLMDGDQPSGTRVELKIPINGTHNHHNRR